MINSSSPDEEIRQQKILYLESLRTLNLRAFLSHYHDDVFGWPGDQPAPMEKAAIGQAEAAEMAAIQPGSITIESLTSHVRTFGKVGIIDCEMHFDVITKDGAPLSTDMRWTHTWLRTEAGWKIIEGMSLPVSPTPNING